MKVFLSLLLLFSVTAQGATTPAPVADSDFPWMKDDIYKKEKVAARKRGERSIASSIQVNDQLLSAEFKATRAKFLEIKTANELKSFITKLNDNYAKYPDDVKMMAAMMTPLLQFKAFTYKVYPFLSKEKITHSILLSHVQNFAAFMTMNLPTAAWKAGFDLVTVPSEEDDLKRFNRAADLQNYLVTNVFPAYSLAARRIAQLDLSKKAVVWDNKMFFGTSSFSDNLARYQLVGEGEKYMILANLHFTLADICRFSSYDLNELLPFVKDVAKLYGYDSFFSAVDGLNARKVASVWKKSKYSNLLTLRQNGDKNMMTAFHHMREGSRHLQLAWTELRDRDDNNQAFIRAAIFTPFTQVLDSQVEGLENIMHGKTSVRSDVTGEMVSVDLPGYYANPPQDLKALLPIGFDTTPNMQNFQVAMKNGKSKTVEFRNYLSGRATNWDVNAYKSLFPNLSKGTDVAHAMKILNQSVSGMVPAMMIQPFMLY